MKDTRKGTVKSASSCQETLCAEEAFELRLVVLAGVNQVMVGGMGKSEGI